jgi:hypothetical protein
MLIWENGSDDSTMLILEALCKEGLPIRVLNQALHPIDILGTNLTVVYDELLKIAFEEYDADWVIPIDADEFWVCTAPPCSIREQISLFDPSKCNVVQWIPGIWGGEWIDSDDFPEKERANAKLTIWDNMTRIFLNEEALIYDKALFSRQLYQAGCKWSLGSHVINDRRMKCLPIIVISGVGCVHVPLRNYGAFVSKVILGKLDILAYYDYNFSERFSHYNILYSTLLKQGGFTRAQMLFFSAYYSCPIMEQVALAQSFSQDQLLYAPIRETFGAPCPTLLYNNLQQKLAVRELIVSGAKKFLTTLSKRAVDSPSEEIAQVHIEVLMRIMSEVDKISQKLVDNPSGFERSLNF